MLPLYSPPSPRMGDGVGGGGELPHQSLAQSDHARRREGSTLDIDLLDVRTVLLQVGGDVHPVDLPAPGADHHHHRIGLRLPVFGMARLGNGEGLLAAEFERMGIRIAEFELQIDPNSAGFALVVLELDLAINPMIGVGNWPEYLPGLTRNGKGMADQDQFSALVVYAAEGELLHIAHLLLHLL